MKLKTIFAAFAAFAHEYALIEPTASFALQAVEDARPPCDKQSTQRLVGFLNACPFGPQRFSPVVEGLVETSMTCAIGTTEDLDCLKFTVSVRSSSQSQIDFMYRKLECLCAMAGMAISRRIGEYPGWDPDPESKVTKVMEKIYAELYGKQPWVYACHAGLECGLIMQKYPGMDCTSVGPEVNFPHSPDERCLISSVPPFMEVIRRTLEELE